MEQQPSEETFGGQLGRDRGESFNLPYGVTVCAAPPVTKRRLRSGPYLHSGETHHCLAGLYAREKQLYTIPRTLAASRCSLHDRAPALPGWILA